MIFLMGLIIVTPVQAQEFSVNNKEYFEKQGANVLVFSNWYDGNFSDSKMSGIEIIHHGERTATNGDVRIHHTPEQWDAIPSFVERNVDAENGVIEAWLEYPDYDFEYKIRAEAKEDGIALSVHVDEAVPDELEGRVGFNFEFLPPAYFEKTYYMDQQTGVFPLYPTGPMNINEQGETEPTPLVKGKKLVLAPNDPTKRVTITSGISELMLFDGRAKAQNGWFVVRSLIPAGETGKVVDWFLEVNNLPNWMRTPVITHSQVGYHPSQTKQAVIELDANDEPLEKVSLFKVQASGDKKEVHAATPKEWGMYQRYNYLQYDFSEVTEPGIYVIKYGEQESDPFQIGENVFEKAWHPTLDIFFPVQMDHMFVEEAYRVWHGASHLDDALQAPVNHEHFDLYAQGPTTDTDYEPGEHIPGLNYGGWYDAGDYDIRTQTQYYVVQNMAGLWNEFAPQRDNTTVEHENKYVKMHSPDGIPDLQQQIKHGTLALLAQWRAVDHAIPGIVSAHLHQYTHLGDGVTKTDGLIYNPEMDSLESDGTYSGRFDDRWAFTTETTALNYGSAAALAAASVALQGYDDELASEALETAKMAWNREQNRDEPKDFRHGNTTGGNIWGEELKATVELLIANEEQKYADRVKEMLPEIEERFMFTAALAVRAYPFMDDEYKATIDELVSEYCANLKQFAGVNPFGVPITEGGWAGNGTIVNFALSNYQVYKAFPDQLDENCVFKALHYLFGTHPDSNISFVSGVGAKSKKVAYGMNRADYSFIAGGIVPGVLILPPDFPENKENWPFLWGENEYVISVGASYMYLVHAVNKMLEEK
ncbi:glycoside hydrolase family 9 protein [Gracilimonas mengyeensis]|nr:glycoside hydrolase family 9 protein [Gracilimonas mengyeensis]